MYEAEAAADIDPEVFTWMVFKRKTALRTPENAYHRKHTLVLNYGDVYGVYLSRKNVYQVIKADALHIVYRGVPPSVHDRMLTNSIPYKGATPSYELEAGYQRAKRVNTKVVVETKSKSRLEPYFKPDHKVVETSTLDYKNYQWRKITKRLKIESKKSGKTKTILQVGDIVGLRYLTPASGSYIIYDDDKRVMVTHELFTDVIHNSRVLPLSQQRDETIDLPTGIKIKAPDPERSAVKRRSKVVEKEDERVIPPILEEEPIVPKYDLSGMIDFESIYDSVVNERRRNNKAKRTGRLLDNIMALPDVPEVSDDEEDFEDTETPVASDSEETEAVEETQDESEETPEDEETEETPEEEEPDSDSDVADELEPGTQFSIGNKTFVVVDSHEFERNDKLMEYYIYETENNDDDFMLYKLRLPHDYPISEFSKHAEILEEEYDADELKSLYERIEYASFKTLPLLK